MNDSPKVLSREYGAGHSVRSFTALGHKLLVNQVSWGPRTTPGLSRGNVEYSHPQASFPHAWDIKEKVPTPGHTTLSQTFFSKVPLEPKGRQAHRQNLWEGWLRGGKASASEAGSRASPGAILGLT